MGTIIDFESIYKGIKDAVISTATSNYKNYKDAVISDVTDFLEKAKDKIKEYTLQLSEKKISKDEFEFNVAGLKELCEMQALKECGIALIKLDELKSKIGNVIITTVLSKI